MSGNESIAAAHYDQVTTWPRDGLQADIVHIGFGAFHRGHQAVYRSEERRVGKECRSRWSPYH